MSGNTENKIIAEISGLKVEMKYIAQTLYKVEKVLENQNSIQQKVDAQDEKMLDMKLEIKELEKETKELKTWKTKAQTTFGIVTLTFGFIMSKLF